MTREEATRVGRIGPVRKLGVAALALFTLALAWRFREPALREAETGLTPRFVVAPPLPREADGVVALGLNEVVTIDPITTTPRAFAELPLPPPLREEEEAPMVERPTSSFDWSEPPSALSVGDRAWLLSPPSREARPAPTALARRQIDGDASHVLRDPLHARDEELGLRLPAAGSIASVIATTVRADTPPVSTATFVASLDAQGRVDAITVTSFSAGEASAWQEAARAAERALAGQVFALPSALVGGAVVTVEIAQNLELPSGRGRRHRLRERPPVVIPRSIRRSPRREGVGVAAFLPPDLAHLGAPETMAPPLSDTAPVTTASELPCACRGGFDLVDIGAHEQRVVKVATQVGPRRQPPPSPPPPRAPPPPR